MAPGRKPHSSNARTATPEKNSSPTSLHIPTPLLYSTTMSKQAGCNVWLKLENLQPTQSFKIRGIGNYCAKAVLERNIQHLVTVGDTNAALAVAFSSRQLDMPCTIFVPVGMAASSMRTKIEIEGAQIVERGATVREAYEAGLAFVSETSNAHMVESSDDDDVVAGYATMAAEISVQLHHKDPAAVVCAVGSGGLLAGLITGMQRCRWRSVPIIAVETHNTNSFQQALLSGASDTPTTGRRPRRTGGKSALQLGPKIPSLFPPMDGDALLENEARRGSLPRLTRSSSNTDRASEPTVATCLQASAISSVALELAGTHPVVPISVSEAMAAEACLRLVDEHQMLVEVGSAAALSVVGKSLVHQIVPDLDAHSHIVVVVSGGANISFEKLEACRQRFPFPAPIIAKSGQEIFMRMSDSNSTPTSAPAVRQTSAISTSTTAAAATLAVGRN